MPKQAQAKRAGVINPQNYNFNQFLTRRILNISTVELGYMYPRRLPGPPAMILTK